MTIPLLCVWCVGCWGKCLRVQRVRSSTCQIERMRGSLPNHGPSDPVKQMLPAEFLMVAVIPRCEFYLTVILANRSGTGTKVSNCEGGVLRLRWRCIKAQAPHGSS